MYCRYAFKTLCTFLLVFSWRDKPVPRHCNGLQNISSLLGIANATLLTCTFLPPNSQKKYLFMLLGITLKLFL